MASPVAPASCVEYSTALPCRGQPDSEATGLRPAATHRQSESRRDRLSQLKLPRCAGGFRFGRLRRPWALGMASGHGRTLAHMRATQTMPSGCTEPAAAATAIDLTIT